MLKDFPYPAVNFSHSIKCEENPGAERDPYDAAFSLMCLEVTLSFLSISNCLQGLIFFPL